jgi:hypothetical protein
MKLVMITQVCKVYNTQMYRGVRHLQESFVNKQTAVVQVLYLLHLNTVIATVKGHLLTQVGCRDLWIKFDSG